VSESAKLTLVLLPNACLLHFWLQPRSEAYRDALTRNPGLLSATHL
jgi:hypothetical protein